MEERELKSLAGRRSSPTEALVNGTRFVSQDGAHDFDGESGDLAEDLSAWDPQSEVLVRRILREGDLVQVALGASVDDTTDASPVDGARAHATGFGRGVESRLSEKIPRELDFAGGLAHEIRFCVSRAVVSDHH